MENTLTLAQESTGRAKSPDRLLALGTGIFILLVLFGLWPYQHWSFEGARQSVLVGWAKVLVQGKGEWEFCFVVPFIVGFLVHRQRADWKDLPVQGDWAGAPIVLLGAVFYWLGYKVDTGYLGYAALQTILAGLILLLGGRAWWRALIFPWLFLIFAWPLFPLDDLMAARLKIPTAQAAALVLRILGVETVRVGSALKSASDPLTGLGQGDKFSLEVSDTCSGMRSIYSLIMISVLYGALALKRPLGRWVLFLSSVPLAILGNVFRLLMLAFGTLWFGQGFAIGVQNGDHLEESTYHLLCGFAVFGFALAGIFALATLIEGSQWKRLKALNRPPARKSAELDQSGGKPAQTLVKTTAATALSALAILLCASTPTKVTLAEPGIKPLLPEHVGDYISRSGDMTAKERDNFEPGVQLERRFYANPQGINIAATLVLSGEVKKTLHDPRRCLPDAGWILTDSEVVTIRLENGRELQASVMHVFEDTSDNGRPIRHRGQLLYWYEGAAGVSTPSYMGSNYLSYRDAIFRNLNHRWGQVAFFLHRVEPVSDMVNPMMEVIALEELKNFVSKCAPEFLISTK